jgi:SSS family solute:Na+ symporter
MQLANLDIAIIVVYFIGLFTLAQWLSRSPAGRRKDSSEYFLASKNLPWWAIGASLIAANISAEQIVVRFGTSRGFNLCSIGVVLLLVALYTAWW